MDKDKVPQESETIAARRSARLAEKIKNARLRFSTHYVWWNNQIVEFFGLAFVVFLNGYLISSFWNTTAIATSFSGPVIPLLAKGLGLFGVSFGVALQKINVAFLLLFPLTFYFFVRRVSGRKLVALLAALFASLPIYPFAEVRIRYSLLGQDAPHIASLAILPIALHSLLAFIHNGGVKNLIIAAFFSALIALISPFGSLVYVIFAFITAFSELLLGQGRARILRLAVVFVFAASLTSFWYNPAFFFWMVAGPLGVSVREMFSKLIPISFFILPVLGTFGFLLFDRKPDLQPIFLASFYTISLGIIVMAGGGLFPSHPNRYAPEFGISLAFLLGILLERFARFFKAELERTLSQGRAYFLANGLLILCGVVISLAVVLGKDGLTPASQNVLGLWTDVAKGDIWMAKEGFGGIYSVFGHAITALSVFSLGFLGVRSSRQKSLA